jgi:hypothetical protein
MISQKLQLINEQSSPLFRIMFIQNAEDNNRRQFDNNICAFHIGDGWILSVAHNLRTEARLFKSIPQPIFLSEIFPQLNQAQIELFDRCYPLDVASNKRYMGRLQQQDMQQVMDTIRQTNFDTRWLNLMNRGFCKPNLIVQFRNNQFYNNASLTARFDSRTYFAEPAINRHTYLLELELVEAFFHEDIALYRIINSSPEVIASIPSIEISYNLLEHDEPNLYCLQSSPNSEVGKLLNQASIEGFVDHFGIFPDRIGGNYTFEGMRYLIKGYFRFGSSGAPYIHFDTVSNTYKVNAIQSEASPIQLTINNNREGNFQYINAIASPLKIIQERLQFHLGF